MFPIFKIINICPSCSLSFNRAEVREHEQLLRVYICCAIRASQSLGCSNITQIYQGWISWWQNKLGNWFWEFPVRERIVLRTVWNSKSRGMTRTKDVIVMGKKRQWTDTEWLKVIPEMPVLLQVTSLSVGDTFQEHQSVSETMDGHYDYYSTLCLSTSLDGHFCAGGHQ